MSYRISTIILVTLMLLAALACKRSSQSEGQPGVSVAASGSGSAKVHYKPNVVVMSETEASRDIVGQGTNGAAFILDRNSQTAASLKPGSVLLVKGSIARKVLGVQTVDEGVVVLTQQALLGDVVQDGNIQINAPIRFTAAQAKNAPAAPVGWWLDPLPVYAQEGARLNKAQQQGENDALKNLGSGAVHSVIDGWQTSFHPTFSPGRLDLDLTLTKNVGGFVAKIGGQGYISNFDFSSSFGVDQGITDRISTGFKDLNGEMNFQWEVGKDTPGVENTKSRIKLPAAVSIPLAQFLDGFPLFLDVSSAILISPAVSGGKEYSKGSFHITYDGYQNFNIAKGNVDGSGSVNGKATIDDPTNLSAVAPMGLVVAFAAPRLELSFGAAKVLKMDTIKVAAERVDFLADQVAKGLLGPEDYQAFKDGPYGQLKLSKAADNVLKSDAAAYFEMVSSSGMSFSGDSAILPCSRTDVTLVGTVGGSGEMLGQSLGESSKEIFRQAFSRVTPPGVKLCESIGQ